LSFGTAGVRGILGVGTNRLNTYMIYRITLGLIKYLKSKKDKNISVAIGRDNRHMSAEFNDLIIRVLNQENIKVYTFSDIVPTPVLSFATANKKCDAGIMITASHNPKNYNGFKVYGDDGAQLSGTDSASLSKFVENISFEEVLAIDFDKLTNDNATILDNAFLNEYESEVLKIRRNLNVNYHLPIVFSPIHGTSYRIVPSVLRKAGFKKIIEVASQNVPDPDFSNTLSSNPEEETAYIEAIKVADLNNSKLVIITDPDADRLGVCVKVDDK